MPPKVPPPPRPDPITLDQIYAQLTSSDVSFDTKAYNVVALNTVAFHSSVKLFFFDDPALASTAAAGTSADATAAVAGKLRREKLIKNVAFMLAQRNNAICHECRWETVSLLGELCRLDQTHKGAPTSAPALLEAKLNGYAKANLEFLAQLPWFLPSIDAIIKAGGGHEEVSEGGTTAGAVSGEAVAASGSSSRAALKEKLRAARQAHQHPHRGNDGRTAADVVEGMEEDEDVVIALMDIRRALPRYTKPTSPSAVGGCFDWTDANVEQARDLMFVDASTSMLHLIPAVARSGSDVCAQCLKRAPATTTSPALLRCGSCKAVYYCSPECQKAHWTTVHRTPCRAYKARCDSILEQYYAANSVSAKRKKKELATGEVVILEVPLEPSLFYETRRYLYDHRDESFEGVEFSEYFMKYNVRGT
ncbi:MYND zinc finger (ZnF) domain-like protein [Leptomonas pyrrhocoris]|uniref:MYND zinc finger (ZnF) domain-like protein n=1 Tax=Leptomonas pyrrhocoris TaxID=157538 RepID=A0A0N0VFD6_LEPPY|nr:MYND zinc finger (ZnF) domain-like protein [Leptomonas pyrrhocoris]XP_015659310.1 MYND zinc finger (ZnF) domain-like protein [Leptomonas pyrrhocoris]KPA80870.1 MYND zinc finger (ZnF) domain-like protein [Leptomonas pyrrhocoris]KPA80871.1 MYND zinc finger (ZnF) domain-like protein [Leptomonas pyrrhocoris]|eukprot:XP_015659309.1 MYND zinc finger (ZnF) domain-like protein [Leptomonas pyrrhocoris]